MTKQVTTAALIIAIVMAMSGVAMSEQPNDSMDSQNQPSKEATPYGQHASEGEHWQQDGELDADPHPVHEVGDNVPRIIGDELPPRDVSPGEEFPDHTLLAGVDQCTDTHTIDATDPVLARQQLDAILVQFQNNTLFRAKFIVCIEIVNAPLLISSPINISTGANTSDQIVIELRGGSADGLPLKAAPDFSGQHLVKIQSSGPSIALVDWEIDGQGTDTCLEIDSADNTVVVSSTIKNCAVNVRIANSNGVRLGPETDEEFFRWKNEILDYSQAGILVESGTNNTFAYNIIHNPMIFPDLYHDHAVIIERNANRPLGKMQTVSPPLPLKQIMEGNEALMVCTQAPDGVIRPRLKFANPTGRIVWYRQEGETLGLAGTCKIGSDGICYIYHPEFVDDQCDCKDVRNMNALYTSKNTSEFMGRIACPTQAIDKPVEKPSALGDGATIPTPAPMASDDSDVDVSSLAAGASGGCGKGGASLVANDIASTHVPTLGLWWIGIAVGIVIGVRSRARSFLASRRQRARKDQSRS